MNHKDREDTALFFTVLFAVAILMILFVVVKSYGEDLRQDVWLRCRETDVPYVLASRLIYTESRWNPRAIGDREVIGNRSLGLMQLSEKYLPDYARRFNGGEKIDPFNPRVSIRIGLYYLAQLYRRFGSWWAAVAAYNCGASRVERGLIPRSTIKYADYIMQRPELDRCEFEKRMTLK